MYIHDIVRFICASNFLFFSNLCVLLAGGGGISVLSVGAGCTELVVGDCGGGASSSNALLVGAACTTLVVGVVGGSGGGLSVGVC
jgi:hypothetical protein